MEKCIVAGVGKDAPTEINKYGGKQSKTEYRLDLIPTEAIFPLAKVLKEGEEKYGSDKNWKRISTTDHLNHALIHIYAHLAGDTQDDHLSHALCRLAFAITTYTLEQVIE